MVARHRTRRRRPRGRRRTGAAGRGAGTESWSASEIAAELRDDPFGAGPQAAFTAAAVVAAALAAVSFAVGAAGAGRARRAEFAVLRALGVPRRRLARTVAAEQAVLVGLASRWAWAWAPYWPGPSCR